MGFLRLVHRCYNSIRNFKNPKDNYHFEDTQSKKNYVRFEVKLKVDKKYESRCLEIRSHFNDFGQQEWSLYIIKYADYTSYDYFSLSKNLIIQLFDDTTNSKCTLVLVEDVLRFKMRSLSDKWRMVEFVRANSKMKAPTCSGLLEASSFQNPYSPPYPIYVFFHHTCLLLVSKTSHKIMGHISIFDFEAIHFNVKNLTFLLKNSSEYWSIYVDNNEKLANLLAYSIQDHLPLKHVEKILF